MKMKHHVIVYDIPEDDRRTKVANLLSGYGERVQLSVFECWLDQGAREELKNSLLRILDLEEDAVRFYVVQDEVDTIGIGGPLKPPGSYIV